MNLNAISKSLFLLVLCAAPCYADYNDLQREILQAQQQALAPREPLSPYGEALQENFKDSWNSIVDQGYANRMSVLDAEVYDLRNRLNKESFGKLALRAETKIQKLIEDNSFLSSIKLFEMFNSDQDLQIAYPTRGDKLSAIEDIENRVGKGQTLRQRIEHKIENSRDNLFSDEIRVRTKALKDLEFYQDALRSLD